jgi:ubiquinone/menaquinone biosynthesis C-methylase UbiE
MRSWFFARLYPHISQPHESMVEQSKRALFARALTHIEVKRVLEIGPGPGVNLAYLPAAVDYLALEPNPHFHPQLQARAGQLGVRLSLLAGQAEAIPLPEASVDLAIGTLVLCSVRDVRTALAEVRRVLRPGGAYLFVEHVAASQGTPLRLVQNLVTPCFVLAGDGCHPNRDPLPILDSLFTRVEAERLNLPLPIVAPHLVGLAWA